MPSLLEFTFLVTEDQSPTVRIGLGENTSEAMHSLKGAFSETVYIYGTAIDLCLDDGFEPRVLSLGLGLGYVEILTAALALRRSQQLSPEKSSRLLANLGGESFELLPELRDWFQAWAGGNASGIPIEFQNTYDTILARTSEHSGIASFEIRDLLKTLLRDRRWIIREALDEKTDFASRFGCICFDAFSSKTSPQLWTEEFLRTFFRQTAAADAVLSTYACTGALKRALRDCGFALNIREGFSSKRDSTFAVRRDASLSIATNEI